MAQSSGRATAFRNALQKLEFVKYFPSICMNSTKTNLPADCLKRESLNLNHVPWDFVM